MASDIEDCAAGIVKASATYNESDPVNLGNGREVVIRDLVEMMGDLSGFRGAIR